MYEDCTLITDGTVIEAAGAAPRPDDGYSGTALAETDVAILEQPVSLTAVVQEFLTRSAV